MKLYSSISIFVWLSIGACVDAKKQTFLNKAPAISVVEISEEKNSRVPSYDYEALSKLLEKKNDTTYVVNFWATWCKPCIAELPAFEQLHAEMVLEKVKVILVSLDFPEKIQGQVIPFLDSKGIKSTVILLDDAAANSWVPAIDKTWSGAIPATLIYKNNQRKFYEQSFTYNELIKEVALFK